MKRSLQRLQEQYGSRHISPAMLSYEQTLDQIVKATGSKNERQDPRALNFRLKENEVYVVRCDDNDYYYRTVMLKRNGLTGSLQSFVSNPVYGETPPGMKEVSATQVLKQMREFNTSDLNAFPFNSSQPLPGQME